MQALKAPHGELVRNRIGVALVVVECASSKGHFVGVQELHACVVLIAIVKARIAPFVGHQGHTHEAEAVDRKVGGKVEGFLRREY